MESQRQLEWESRKLGELLRLAWPITVSTLSYSVMTLVDTLDGVLMLGAYGWAYRDPTRKLFYNMVITSISVVVALAIGGLETLGLLTDQFGFEGQVWQWVAGLNAHLGALGYGIVALFVASWVVSMIVYHPHTYGRRSRRA